MAQLGFSFDISRCSGCMTCTVACMDQNDVPENGPCFRHVTRIETGEYPSAEISFVSISCLNCGDPPCVIVCPTGAAKKRNPYGIVQVNQDLCIGCHSCLMACPIGAPSFPEGKKMSKCNSCLERVTHGLEPACVRACPTRALGFGPMEELAAEKAERASRSIPGAVLSCNPRGKRIWCL